MRSEHLSRSRFHPARASLALIALLAGIASPSTALAIVGSCNPGRPHDPPNTASRFVYTATNVSGVNGVNADILELSPYYSGVNKAGTNGTVMLTKTDLSQWAQLGWYKSKIADSVNIKRQSGIEFYLSRTQNFFEWFASHPVQTQTQYQILEANNNFDFFIAGKYVSTWSGFAPKPGSVLHRNT